MVVSFFSHHGETLLQLDDGLSLNVHTADLHFSNSFGKTFGEVTLFRFVHSPFWRFSSFFRDVLFAPM